MEKSMNDFLEDDIGPGDLTSDALFAKEKGTAEIVAKQDCIAAGLPHASNVFAMLGAKTEALALDGMHVKKGTVVMKVSGPVKSILAGERTALNIISRMSGIASATRRLVDICSKTNPKIQIAGTRKTTPGFRDFEKEAIAIGGGFPHRYGLYDGILIKDNHLAALRMSRSLDSMSAIKEALRLAKAGRKTNSIKIEIEVTTMAEAQEAARLSPDEIMLDNFPSGEARKAFAAIKKINPKILVEVSGGITEANIAEYTFADRISLGALTHSVKCIDFSLEVIDAKR
ncbi:MAG: nicotinate-nucleotide diphosphorylase (carboxylating) [Thermoplasmata archaeon HGW-Thermoplasmata-2]|nr:MAG: nicotinate-nucleotide diphosphorylase (carboxylating) [Thermoplasmata archaeon HGW-Thermoplasmata-2]